MEISKNTKVNDFLTDIQFLSPERFNTIVSIRDLFFDSNSGLDEEIKYGGLVFAYSNDLIGGIFSYKKHVSIEFSQGAKFADEGSILEGSGKHRRHLKIHTDADIVDKNCAYFIRQASCETT